MRVPPLILAVLAFVSAVSAQTIFDNTPAFSPGGFGITTGSGPIAAPFTITSGNYSLTSLSLTLQKQGWPVSFSAELFVGSGQPITKLNDFTFSDPPNGVQTSVTFTPATPQTLTVGSTYWVVISQTSGSGPIDMYGSGNGSSVTGKVNVGTIQAFYSSQWNNTIRTPAFEIEAAAAIPEPETVGALAGISALIFAVSRRRAIWLRKR